jgi:hypothetical protein
VLLLIALILAAPVLGAEGFGLFAFGLAVTLHVLSNRLVRGRCYWSLSNRYRKTRLARFRELLGIPTPEPKQRESPTEPLLRLAGIDITLCPVCGKGHPSFVENLPAQPNRLPTSYRQAPAHPWPSHECAATAPTDP